MYAIGLDIGTTSICGVLADTDTGQVAKVINKENNGFIDGESWEKKQDPLKIIETITEIINEFENEEIEVIGVTGQMHGILYYDKDGKCISPLYIWQDQRGNLPYGKKTYAEHLKSHTGYGNVTHFYNEKNNLVPKEAAGYCTIHDYVVMHLTGNKEAVIHSSDAASFGNYNIKSGKFTIKNNLQPKVCKGFEIAGYRNNIPVSVAIGDNQASFLGGGCDENTLLLNVGTGSQISFITNSKKAPKGLEIRPLADNMKIMVGSSLCGGRAYAILENFFKKVVSMAGFSADSLYDKMAKEAKDTSTGIIFNTLFSGTRENPEKLASVENISTDNFTPADLIAGCLRGISNELYEMYKATGSCCTRLVGTGNGIRKNKILKSIMEDQFKLKMLVPKYSEEAAMGAVVYALVACGKYKSLKEAERIITYENI